jgi:hypothetical protein
MASIWVLGQFPRRNLSLSFGLRKLKSSRVLLLGEGRRSIQQFVSSCVWNNTGYIPLFRRALLQLLYELHKNKET